jgi:transcriptional antiterminator
LPSVIKDNRFFIAQISFYFQFNITYPSYNNGIVHCLEPCHRIEISEVTEEYCSSKFAALIILKMRVIKIYVDEGH